MIPKPTGLGLGSLVRPNDAKRITVNKGPLPRTNKITPTQNSRESRNFGRSGRCSGGCRDSVKGFLFVWRVNNGWRTRLRIPAPARNSGLSWA
jgi:hypothetical protein